MPRPNTSTDGSGLPDSISDNSDQEENPFIRHSPPSPPKEPRQTRRTVIAACLFGILVGYLLRPTFSIISSVANEKECQRTQIFPFRVGCPASCHHLRPSLSNQTLYRISAAWVFGNLSEFRNSATPIPLSAFRGANGLAARFLRTDAELRSNVAAEVSEAGLPELQVRPQEKIHMSLSYLCCLTQDEVATTKRTIETWNASRTFAFPISFSRLQCLHERKDSVTVILNADLKMQRDIMEMNHELKSRIERAGVRVWVDREQQMPFHTTVLGFMTGNGQPISQHLGAIFRGVDSIRNIHAHANISFGIKVGSPKVG